MMGDPLSLWIATLVATKAAEGFGTHLGGDTASALERLIAAVRGRLRGNARAEGALARVEEQPRERDRIVALAELLDEQLSGDRQFQGEIAELARLVGADEGLARILVQITGNAQVGKVVNIDEVHGDAIF
jgi:hypothetical protein